jgi:hypothetical protein
VLSSVSFGGQRDSWLTPAALSMQNLHQNGIPGPDCTIYNGRIAPAFSNAPSSCARDASTDLLFTSQSEL